MRTSHTLALTVCTLLCLATPRADAESGSTLNIHLEPGAFIPVADPLQTPTGQGVSLKVDVPLVAGLAAQANATAISFRSGAYLNPGTRLGGGLGLRYRVLDDQTGYLLHLGANPEGHRGNLFGNLWVDANVLFLGGAGLRTGFDVGVGVEASLVDGLQVGPFGKFVYFGPEKMAVAGLSISVGVPDPSKHDTDLDKDGISEPADKCPRVPEDKDGFEDQDGCPDDDNDRDGIPDGQDGCPNDPEDVDGFEDEDGCPDLDNDRDGVTDDQDRCPTEPEDRDGFQDEDGCPDPDNDGDAIADTQDKCPNQPEDKDGFEDEDGCPDPDNDQDGIADTEDKCPEQPETRNGREDEDGCPEKEAKVFVENKKVVITDKIFFGFNRSNILPRSFPLLDSVADVLQKFPQITLLRVEGHTDDKGVDAYNQKLSEARAQSVMAYLVKKGVSPERLEAVGYGETKPLVENTNAAAREQNRRVEFTILQPEGGVIPVVVDPNAGPEAGGVEGADPATDGSVDGGTGTGEGSPTGDDAADGGTGTMTPDAGSSGVVSPADAVTNDSTGSTADGGTPAGAEADAGR